MDADARVELLGRIAQCRPAVVDGEPVIPPTVEELAWLCKVAVLAVEVLRWSDEIYCCKGSFRGDVFEHEPACPIGPLELLLAGFPGEAAP